MKIEIIQRMQNHLDTIVQMITGENVEFWFTRDLPEPLGYARCENFLTATEETVRQTSCIARWQGNYR